MIRNGIGRKKWDVRRTINKRGALVWVPTLPPAHLYQPTQWATLYFDKAFLPAPMTILAPKLYGIFFSIFSEQEKVLRCRPSTAPGNGPFCEP